MALADGGVLFLDELPEFGRLALEALREPLECGGVRQMLDEVVHRVVGAGRLALAVIGVFLLATAGQGAEKVAEPKAEIIVDPDKSALNKRLENTGWGLFLIILGAYLLLKP